MSLLILHSILRQIHLRLSNGYQSNHSSSAKHQLLVNQQKQHHRATSYISREAKKCALENFHITFPDTMHLRVVLWTKNR